MTPTKKATPKRGGNRGAKTKINRPNVTAFSTFGNNSDPVRQLIRCQDDVLLYELSLGTERSYEVVTPDGESRRFSLRYQAESKWARLLAKMEGGAR
jgi:hypothetical protein